jgi:glutamate-1-semialdehyde 2,1-aminomutase
MPQLRLRGPFVVCAETTLCAKYNDIESVKEIFAANKGEIAGVILEPVVGNSGFIAPTQEFLEVGMHS